MVWCIVGFNKNCLHVAQYSFVVIHSLATYGSCHACNQTFLEAVLNLAWSHKNEVGPFDCAKCNQHA